MTAITEEGDRATKIVANKIEIPTLVGELSAIIKGIWSATKYITTLDMIKVINN